MISVRQLKTNEATSIVNYFHSATPQYLKNMGSDSTLLPDEVEWVNSIKEQINLPLANKELFYLLWCDNKKPVGHSNLSHIVFDRDAKMHLHLWENNKRKAGLGKLFIEQCIPIYFKLFQLKKIICEPYAHNPAPNRLLEKLGFIKIETYLTIPGSINFEQEVCRWELKNPAEAGLF